MFQFFDQTPWQSQDKEIPQFLNLEKAREVLNFHSSFAQYAATNCVHLNDLAEHLGVSKIMIKDESTRFGLPAFKVLGASYAMAKVLAEDLGFEQKLPGFPELQELIKKSGKEYLFVTATDGNHGHGVAWVAQQLGCKAIVYMPQGSKEVRLKRVRDLGSEAITVDGNYDDAVRQAAKTAEERGALLVQDTAWPGYERIPSFIMQGYTTMALEAFEQISEPPTHIFVQAGVGSMAGAVTAFYAQAYEDYQPQVIVVEPVKAACYLQSVQAKDGQIHNVGGDLATVMAGLACGEINPLAWPIMRDYADGFAAMPDDWALEGVARLNYPVNSDEKVTVGESGVAGFALLYQLLTNPELGGLKKELNLNENSKILCFNTEGVTDPEANAAALRRFAHKFK